ncbi:hypothetical protein BYT27DRAFT_7171361 [Phlegmacium glaucopus]|nr:hypothetical protein BYT27DRAFT_7171361 [Phlegmacium glaucopus]
MTTANTNTRASLLAGLRTGGVRSSALDAPHTASPAGTFEVRRISSNYHLTSFSEEDQVTEKFHQNISQDRDVPMTAAVDGPLNLFSQLQGTRGMNPNSIPFSPAPNMTPQAQMQMQMLHLEMMRIQAMQAQQQYQEIMAQATLQQHLQTQGRERRTSLGFNPPATAGPMTNSFDLRAATLSAQMRRANQTDQIRSQLGVGSASDDPAPMTAALGGRFGSRMMSGSLHATNSARFGEHGDAPPTPNSTTVISGGTFLGHPASNPPSAQIATPSKSDSASSWRRGGNNNSVLSANRAVSSPSLKVTPPSDVEHLSPSVLVGSPPGSLSGLKSRPQPLRFSSAVSQPLPTVAIDTTDDETDGETHSSGSSIKSVASNSSPTTSRSSTSNEMPLSPREEASKRLYEGLGIGRPVSSTHSDGGYPHLTVLGGPGHRMVSQPTRQPRGPPSGDELGPKNFATRIRRKAIGGLGMLMGARERREVVEAY